MNNQITAPIDVSEKSIFSNVEKFQQVQFMAEFLSQSDLVPKDYQKKPANVLIALSMAERMKADPMMVMQNLYVIHGRPSWSSQFLISCANSCGRFSSMQYEFFGEPNTDSWGCTAYSTELSTNQIVRGPSITIAMAKAEGWYGKNGSKWKTLPELMLTYRAAAFFVRTKAPEISMGMQTEEETRDMGKAEVVYDNEPAAKTNTVNELKALQQKQMQKTEQKPAPEVVNEPELENKVQAAQESDIDQLVFIKKSIDLCNDLDGLTEIGDDIKVKIDDDELTEFEIKEARAYLKAARTKLKNP